MIYYLADVSNNLVKIGHTSPNQMLNRFKNLATGNAFEFRLIGCHSGNIQKEKDIHRILRAHRKEREWFYLDMKVIQYIEEHNDYEYFYDVFENQIHRNSMNEYLYKRFIQSYEKDRLNKNIKVLKTLSEWLEYELKIIQPLDDISKSTYTVIDSNKECWRERQTIPPDSSEISAKMQQESISLKDSVQNKQGNEWKNIKKRNDTFPF